MERDETSPFAVIAHFQKRLPVDLDGLAVRLGLRVFKVPLGSSVSGQLMRDGLRGGPAGFAIFVNSEEHQNRQRFTLAHEIAHFILHRDLIESGLIDDTMYRSSLSSWEETQANRLAADILMPIMIVKGERSKLPPMSDDDAARALSAKFGVSQAAMKIRLGNLKRPAA